MRLLRVALVCVLSALLLGSCLKSSPTDRSICNQIVSLFYYPTIPTSGESVSLQSAIQVEALLKTASFSGLRDEAVPLQQAIDSNNESAMVSIFSDLEYTECPLVGVTPVT
jgi:hypothetical protein